MGKRTKANKAKKRGGMEAGQVAMGAAAGATPAEEAKPAETVDPKIAALQAIKEAVATNNGSGKVDIENLKALAISAGASEDEVTTALIKDVILPMNTVKEPIQEPMQTKGGGWRGGENIGWSLGGELPAEMVGGYHRGKRHSKKAKRGGSLNYSLLGGRRRTGRKTGRKRR